VVTPTPTISAQFRAAEAACMNVTDLNGAASITDPHGKPLTSVAFHQAFVLHTKFRYPLAQPFPDNIIGGSLLISRIDGTGTPQSLQMQDFNLPVAGITDLQLPLSFPVMNTAIGQPDTTPGFYCLSAEGSYIDSSGTPSSTESVATLIAVH
jgi:hypothetical protein